MSEVKSSSEEEQFHLPAADSFFQRWRLIKDQWVRYGVVAGGLGVIGAVVLIFFYLLYVVLPLFYAAESAFVDHYEVPGKNLGETAFLAMEEQNEVAVRFTKNGQVIFFKVQDGEVLKTETLAAPEQAEIISYAQGSLNKGVIAFGLSNGQVLVTKHDYKISYPNDVRVITPHLEYPLGEQPLTLDPQGRSLQALAIRVDEDQSTLAAKTADGQVVMSSFIREESLFDDEEGFERTDAVLEAAGDEIDFILLDKDQRNLYLADAAGTLTFVDVGDKGRPVIKHKQQALPLNETITSLEFLNGELSLLVGSSSGTVSQWTLVRDEQNRSGLQMIRSFKVSDSAIAKISAEQRRKGFVAIDDKNLLGIYHSTAERELIKEKIADHAPVALALSPRANAFLVEAADHKIHFWEVDNEHPEVSMSSIWKEVWYESYPKPDYIWQSSSASNDFEPKMSLTPLVFGTLKAAFYAMLVAIPLALMGAIYTAYFMAPSMRQLVKPTIEIMEALPTVILGFLAGLWLAPFVEENLVGIFSLLMIVPLAVIVFAYFWQYAPKQIRHKIPEGWDAAVLVPVIILGACLAFALSGGIEAVFFNGDMRVWMQNEFGIGYDQRNSLVVGLAMGFAVIPTIFSIAEDAIFSVPKHLTTGSLALGATPWQTMVKVVLLTASPGIFSAVMIGFGRAVGETMIVLMATGNTPVMDLSIFQGMRTLSANIAVEMPESEVDSTHYRVLFLAALVLFMFTFVFNTLAELVRQNLRQKYSSL